MKIKFIKRYVLLLITDFEARNPLIFLEKDNMESFLFNHLDFRRRVKNMYE